MRRRDLLTSGSRGCPFQTKKTESVTLRNGGPSVTQMIMPERLFTQLLTQIISNEPILSPLRISRQRPANEFFEGDEVEGALWSSASRDEHCTLASPRHWSRGAERYFLGEAAIWTIAHRTENAGVSPTSEIRGGLSPACRATAGTAPPWL